MNVRLRKIGWLNYVDLLTQVSPFHRILKRFSVDVSGHQSSGHIFDLNLVLALLV